MNHYQDLVQQALRSGEYKSSPEAADRGAAQSGQDESLRSFLRSKMEWIVAREAFDAREQNEREGSMKLAQYVKFREEKFGGVLFETKSEKVFTLSPTGAAVVREIMAGGDSKTVVERLKAKYQDHAGVVERDAVEFIASLKTQGLVTE